MNPQSVRRSRHYQLMRRHLMQREPLCRSCAEQGYIVAAVELDHIVPVHKAPDRVLDANNLQPLCRSCHEAKTLREARHIRGATIEGDPL